MIKAGWIMTALLLLFLLPASVAPKLAGAPAARDALEAIGWPTSHLLLLGLLELGCLVLFVIPRTSLFGAILMTGLLGGAMASHLRADSPLYTHTLFSVYVGLFMWAALWLRQMELRDVLLPWRRAPFARAEDPPLSTDERNPS